MSQAEGRSDGACGKRSEACGASPARCGCLTGSPALDAASWARGANGASACPETLLDSLVGTILSQNTTDTNSRRAFLSLKQRFPTWTHVLQGRSVHTAPKSS